MLSLVTPTYNERENLPVLAEKVHQSLDGCDYELIVVDDDSPDGTADCARDLSAKYPIRVICRKNERGLASAVVAGFNQARGKVFGVIDADLQHPPERIPELLEEIQKGADIAIASRYVSGGGIEGWRLRRRIVSKVATAMARTFLPSVRKVKDPLSGFFLLKREVIEGAKLRPIGYKILLEVLARGKADGIKEVPYTFQQREWGESHLRLQEQVNYLKHLSSLARDEKELRRFFKFCLVGLSGVGVNMGVFWLLTRPAGVYDLVSLVFSVEASILSNFALNDIWTFRDRRVGSIRATLGRAFKFNLVSIGAIAIYYAVYTPLTRLLGVYDLLALLIAIAFGVAWNFGVNTLWTWRRSSVLKEAPSK